MLLVMYPTQQKIQCAHHPTRFCVSLRP